MFVRNIEHFSGTKKKKYKVRFDCGTDLCLYEKEIKAYGIIEGEDFSKEEYERLLSEVLIPRAKRRAMHLLEKQDRTKADLERKLKQSGYPDEAIDIALNYVMSYRYIDDNRYAQNFVYFNQGNKSKRRIMQDLLGKGVSKDIIEKALEGYEGDESYMIRALLKKKKYDSETADRKDREKMYRYLASKGFSSDDILSALKWME